MGLSDSHPGPAKLSRASGWPPNGHRGGSPVLPVCPPCRVPASLPRWDRRGPVALGRDDSGLPLSCAGSAPTTLVFGACSTFTRVLARRLAERQNRPLSPRAPDRSLPPDRPRLLPGMQPPPGVGLAPTGTHRPFTAHARSASEWFFSGADHSLARRAIREPLACASCQQSWGGSPPHRSASRGVVPSGQFRTVSPGSRLSREVSSCAETRLRLPIPCICGEAHC